MDLFKNKNFWLALILVCLITISFSLTKTWSFYYLIGLIFILLILIFIKYTEIGLYLIAFLYPFTYLEFVYNDINVPYVDLVVLILFFAWLIKALYLHFTNKKRLNLKNFPGWFFMLLFVSACTLSLLNVDSELLSFSIKYILRPIIFFYLMYVVLPFNIIDNFKKFYNTLKVVFVLGMGLSLMGIWSLIFPPTELGLRSAVPISIFGIYPLGTNHNLLAEIFVGLIPLAFILFWQEKDILLKNIYLIGALLMTVVNLLTLSRAGWLALTVDLLVLIILKYKFSGIRKFFTTYLPYLILILLVPIFYLMYKLITSTVVISSNLYRLKLMDVALTLFKEKPLLGTGIGTFTTVLAQFRWYIIEYGEVLDAHSFLFKTLAETGFLGAFTFCALLLYVLYVLFRAYNKVKDTSTSWLILGMLLTVLGVIVFELFGTGYYLAKLWLPIGLALASIKLSGLNFTAKNKIYAK
jgi:O-antigen ligase